MVSHRSWNALKPCFAAMIKLRLTRFGKKRETSFRLVAMAAEARREGSPLEVLGFYNPRSKETRLDTEGLRRRLEHGAQPTDTVRGLLERAGLLKKTRRPPSQAKADQTASTQPTPSPDQ